jgi:hypothetical protein
MSGDWIVRISVGFRLFSRAVGEYTYYAVGFIHLDAFNLLLILLFLFFPSQFYVRHGLHFRPFAISPSRFRAFALPPTSPLPYRHDHHGHAQFVLDP